MMLSEEEADQNEVLAINDAVLDAVGDDTEKSFII